MRLAGVAAATGMAGALLATAPMTAAAETTPLLHTVTVQGVAEVPISASANQPAAVAAYRAAMAAAIADGLSKAQFLAAQVGTTLFSPAAVTPGIVEGSGSINCPSGVEYSGSQPDWAFGGGQFAASTPAPVAKVIRPSTAHKKKRPKHHLVKKAATQSCSISAGLTITFVFNN